MKNKIVDFVNNLLVVKQNDLLIIKKIKQFILNNIELVLYIIVGAMTTFINLFIFTVLLIVFDNYLHLSIPSWQVAELIAFVVAVIFSFTCDKFIVFKVPFVSLKKILTEFIQFVLARIFVEVIQVIIMHLLIDICGMSAYIVKLLVMIVVIILNYLTSKFIIFRK